MTTKVHAAVDALGNPLHFIITAGQRNEMTQADHLTQGFRQSCLIADKAYDKFGKLSNLEEFFIILINTQIHFYLLFIVFQC